jgi:hypothetical protein
VYQIKRCLIEKATPNTGLIGRDRNIETGGIELRNRVNTAGYRMPFSGILYKVDGVMVNHTVTIEYDELTRHASILGRRQAGNICNLKKQSPQLAEQRQTVIPDRVVFSHYHHVIKKGVNRNP